MAEFISPTYIHCGLVNAFSTTQDSITILFDDITRDQWDEYDKTTGEVTLRRGGHYQIEVNLYSSDSSLGAVDVRVDGELLININLADSIDQLRATFTAELSAGEVITVVASKPVAEGALLINADANRTRFVMTQV